MNFFQRLQMALQRFFYGRNGMDALNWCFFVVAMVLSLVTDFLHNQTVFNILYTLYLVLITLMLFRLLSKNLGKRRGENARFLKKIAPLRTKVSQLRDKEHKYFTCPQCKTVCRVPKGKGKLQITCPKCRHQIQGKS